MKLRKAYTFRMRPTKTQEAALYRMAGARRFVYNWALARRKSYYAEHGKGIPAKQLSSELTAMNAEPDTHWLKEADSRRSSFLAVTSPGFSYRSPDEDGHLRECNPAAGDLSPPLGYRTASLLSACALGNIALIDFDRSVGVD